MSLAFRVRQSCRRSFSTTTTLMNKKEVVDPELSRILDKQKSQDGESEPAENLYRYFQADQFLNPSSLSYKSCTRSRQTHRQIKVAPTPSVARQNDIFHKLNLDPRNFTHNSSILFPHVTEMGKIRPRAFTMLTVKNQRLLGRTIRRAKMMGVVPMFSK